MPLRHVGEDRLRRRDDVAYNRVRSGCGGSRRDRARAPVPNRFDSTSTLTPRTSSKSESARRSKHGNGDGPGDPLTGSIVSTTESFGASQPAGRLCTGLAVVTDRSTRCPSSRGSAYASPLMMYWCAGKLPASFGLEHIVGKDVLRRHVEIGLHFAIAARSRRDAGEISRGSMLVESVHLARAARLHVAVPEERSVTVTQIVGHSQRDRLERNELPPANRPRWSAMFAPYCSIR